MPFGAPMSALPLHLVFPFIFRYSFSCGETILIEELSFPYQHFPKQMPQHYLKCLYHCRGIDTTDMAPLVHSTHDITSP